MGRHEVLVMRGVIVAGGAGDVEGAVLAGGAVADAGAVKDGEFYAGVDVCCGAQW